MAAITRLDPGRRMSRAAVYAGTVYTAGHVDDAGTDVARQTANILARLDELLERAGSDRSHILSANIWLADIGTFDAMNAIWDAWIDPQHPPARATVQSALAGPQYLVEISLIAALR